MRAALLLLIAGCAAASPKPRPVVSSHAIAGRCDPAAWHAAFARPARARIGLGPPLGVVARDGDELVLADATQGAIVVRRTPIAALARVIVRATEVSPAPGVAPSPEAGVWLEPGFTLPRGAGWLEVGLDNGVHFTGWVPADAGGAVWDEPAPPPRAPELAELASVRAAPDAGAPEVASVTAGVPATFAADAPRWGWARVEVRAYDVRVAGWVDREPVRHGVFGRGTYEFSDDVIEGELVGPKVTRVRAADDTCIRAAPRDDAGALGIVTGPLEISGDAPPGWRRVVLATVWGRMFGYIALP